MSILELSDKEFKKFLRKILGFKPRNLELYQRAFIHKSATYINHRGKVVNNERLEFLGDAVLDAVVGDFVFRNFPADDEGFLTKTRSKLVNATTLYFMAKEIRLDKLLLVDLKGNFNRKNICGDALEALIGAIYLDRGFEYAYRFILNKLLRAIDTQKIIDTEYNYKSIVYQYAQKKHINIFFNTQRTDKNNFVSVLSLGDKTFRGEGFSKKEAEQKASEIAYKNFIQYEDKS